MNKNFHFIIQIHDVRDDTILRTACKQIIIIESDTKCNGGAQRVMRTLILQYSREITEHIKLVSFYQWFARF